LRWALPAAPGATVFVALRRGPPGGATARRDPGQLFHAAQSRRGRRRPCVPFLARPLGSAGLSRGGPGAACWALAGRRSGPGHGRERLVRGQLGPVLLVGELVPLAVVVAGPVIVVIALAAVRSRPALAGGWSRCRLAA